MFRGAKLDDAQIQQWLTLVGREVTVRKNKIVADHIKLQGFTMTSINPEVAMRLATCTQDELAQGLKPVIFIMLIQSHMSFTGFRMDRPHFSSHYADDEVVLMDHLTMFVSNVEDYIYRTTSPYYQQYNENKFTVIYLFNHS